MPATTREVSQKAALEDYAKFRAKPQDASLYVGQLAVLLRAGVPLLEGLEAVNHGVDDDMAAAGEIICRRIASGHTLSVSLQMFPGVFPDLYAVMAKVGENTGNLAESLEQAATWHTKEQDLKNKMKSAMTYPVSVLVVTAVANLLVLQVSLPQMMAMLESLRVEPPLLTRIVFGIGSIFTHKITYVLVGMAIGGAYAFRGSLFTPEFRRGVFVYAHRTPVLGRLFKATALARISSTLSATERLGLPIHRSLVLAGTSADDPLYRGLIERVVKSIVQGTTLAEAMEVDRRLFPPLFTQTVMVGEEAGHLGDCLDGMTRMYESEVDSLVEALSAAIEPILLGACAAVAGLFILATMLPLQEFMSRLL